MARRAWVVRNFRHLRCIVGRDRHLQTWWPGFVQSDDSLAMKFPWERGVRGRLEISGRRLDTDAPPLRSSIPKGYGEIGFQAALIFPTPGCWEVTGRVGTKSITFVTRVVKIGDGPTSKS